jgi:hypothetical protein
MALFLVGCVPTPQKRQAAFIESEYAAYDRAGTGAIEGHAFLRTNGGDVKTAAGKPISLNPVTSYSTEHYQRSVIGLNTLEGPDPRCDKYYRETIATVDGGFRFDGLPARDYNVFAPIQWLASQHQYAGSIAHAKVTVREGQTIKVVVTRQPD